MSDPIKAALDAACAVASRRDAEDMDDDTVRRIIAAFLRALSGPNRPTTVDGQPVPEALFPLLAEWVERGHGPMLASAVQRAGGGDA